MNQGRVIKGFLSSRKISMPQTRLVRPTSDAIKEMIFNVLQNRLCLDFSQNLVVDVFAGSGALGIEAVSLGAGKCVFVEHKTIAIDCIKKNVEKLGLTQNAIFFSRNAQNMTAKFFDQIQSTTSQKNILAFVDPPYDEKDLLKRTTKLLLQIFQNKENVTIVVETDEDLKFEDCEIVCRKKLGKTTVLFLTKHLTKQLKHMQKKFII